MTADIVDLLAGIDPGSALADLRALRPQARDNAQRSFVELLEPADPRSFPLAERYAIAAFVAGLHGFEQATSFYTDLLGDEAADLVTTIAAAVDQARASGPFGVYRESGLSAESVPGPAWEPSAAIAASLGTRLTTALAHAQLLVLRPRESSADAIRALVDGGWSPDDIVSLSQLISFLAFQLRLSWGLRVLGAATPAPDAVPADATPAGVAR